MVLQVAKAGPPLAAVLAGGALHLQLQDLPLYTRVGEHAREGEGEVVDGADAVGTEYT